MKETKSFFEKHPLLDFAAELVSGALLFYMLYLLWINTPPFDADYSGFRFYYSTK